MNRKVFNLLGQNKYMCINYLNKIKSNFKYFTYIFNPTIINNPYISQFSFSCFVNKFEKRNKTYLFLKSSVYFYIKQFVLFITYIIGLIIYKIYYKKQKNINNTIIDVFFMVDTINKNRKFEENYFSSLYSIFDKHNKNYTFLARFYGVNKNPFKLIEFFKIINKDKRSFLFEYDLISVLDLPVILVSYFKLSSDFFKSLLNTLGVL